MTLPFPLFIRTADAAGFDGVVLSEESVDLYNPKVQRSMQGSQFHIQIIQNPILEAISSFKENDLPVYVSILDKTAKSLNTAVRIIVPTFPGSVKLSKTTHFPYSKLNDFG